MLCRFVYSASEHDFVSMLVAFEEMGVKLNRFDPAEVRFETMARRSRTVHAQKNETASTLDYEYCRLSPPRVGQGLDWKHVFGFVCFSAKTPAPALHVPKTLLSLVDTVRGAGLRDRSQIWYLLVPTNHLIFWLVPRSDPQAVFEPYRLFLPIPRPCTYTCICICTLYLYLYPYLLLYPVPLPVAALSNRAFATQDMHNIRFLLRDTQPSSEAKEDMSKFHKRIKHKKARGLKTPVDAYPGMIFFFFFIIVLQPQRVVFL